MVNIHRDGAIAARKVVARIGVRYVTSSEKGCFDTSSGGQTRLAPHYPAIHVVGLDSMNRHQRGLRKRQQPPPMQNDACVDRARALQARGELQEAVQAYEAALVMDAANADLLVELGLLFEEMGRPLDAFNTYQKLLVGHPKDVRAYNNIAGVLIGLGQYDLAIASSRIAVSLTPDHPGPYLNLGTALRLRGDEEEALATYTRIVALQPDHGEGLVELCHRRQHACDWDGLAEQHKRSWTHSFYQNRLVSPFLIMTSPASASDQLRCARVWGDRLLKIRSTPLARYEPRPADRRSQRIRLGYLSADFHSHATAMLIVDMLEHHDKTAFEVFGYSLGPDDGSPMRRRIVDAFDTFIDLRGQSDAQAADRIHADAIDILLDLKGYTQDARVKILAHRPAPIQVNYLGFPGSMGAPFIDYIIADKHVAPFEDNALFDEKIVHLPHCYQPNDRTRPDLTHALSRADVGLPEGAFVFCCFNNPYKITPEIFDIWMRLLAEKPSSVLWLLASNREAPANLCRETALRGIDPERLIFAPFANAKHHLARLRLADLFLDTAPVNAHTTASEALWAGLPLITCRGDTFASRVAGSLLEAVGLPELVTDTLSSYETSARTLFQNPDQLAAIRKRLWANRLVTPLFDTERYTRNYEQALKQMVRARDANEPPKAFAISEGV
jgi:protein O-GlcNAc transferase